MRHVFVHILPSRLRRSRIVPVGLVFVVLSTLVIGLGPTRFIRAAPSIMSRTDLIYGSEIGAWDMDGGTAIHNAQARDQIMTAHVRVIRWGIWKKFDYLAQGQTQSMTLADFNSAIDGIRSLGAEPFIQLPPVWDQQCAAAPDYWNLAWLKEIIKQAGNRVQLYEFANEPDNYCGWTAQDYATYWSQTVPTLKQYARSLGLTIYIGGPARSTNYTTSVQYVTDFLAAVKNDYLANSNNADYIPDFVSTHTYPNSSEDPTNADILNRVTYWGGVYDQLRAGVNSVWYGLLNASGQPIGPGIKIADTEYNYTIDNADARANDPLFMDEFMQAMNRMFRAHGVWLACQFDLASHNGGALDMLTAAGAPKPLMSSFAAMSNADWAARMAAAAPSVTPTPGTAANRFSVAPSTTPTATPSSTPGRISVTPHPGTSPAAARMDQLASPAVTPAANRVRSRMILAAIGGLGLVGLGMVVWSGVMLVRRRFG